MVFYGNAVVSRQEMPRPLHRSAARKALRVQLPMHVPLSGSRAAKCSESVLQSVPLKCESADGEQHYVEHIGEPNGHQQVTHHRPAFTSHEDGDDERQQL